MRGRWPAGYSATDAADSADAEAWITTNEKAAGLVSTTSVAISVSRSRRPVSAWPAMYLAAANGVTVESAARAHGPAAGQDRQ